MGKENTETTTTWINEKEIKDPRQIVNYNESVLRNRTIIQVIGATPTGRKNQVWFYVQFAEDIYKGAWFSGEFLKKRYPQELIRFYEKHLLIR